MTRVYAFPQKIYVALVVYSFLLLWFRYCGLLFSVFTIPVENLFISRKSFWRFMRPKKILLDCEVSHRRYWYCFWKRIGGKTCSNLSCTFLCWTIWHQCVISCCVQMLIQLSQSTGHPSLRDYLTQYLPYCLNMWLLCDQYKLADFPWQLFDYESVTEFYRFVVCKLVLFECLSLELSLNL